MSLTTWGKENVLLGLKILVNPYARRQIPPPICSFP
jgi:hypothetical protein